MPVKQSELPLTWGIYKAAGWERKGVPPSLGALVQTTLEFRDFQ